MDMWTSFALEPGQWHQAQIGPLFLWILRDEEEWHLVTETQEAGPHAPWGFRAPTRGDNPPADKEVRRWIVPGSAPEISFVPVLPDRPVIVRPESQVQVGPMANGLFFVSIPVWVRILVGKGAEQKQILEEPTVRLTNTWFGTPESGILCYGLRTSARRRFDLFPPVPHRCVCPVRVHNEAAASFSFERMCIRTDHLTIYQGRTRLWANLIHCVVKSLDSATQVEYLKTPPEHEPIARELTPARKPLKRGLFNLVFNNLWTTDGF